MSINKLLIVLSPLAIEVSKAEVEADKLRPTYESAKKTFELARDALNVENRKVFEARSLYLIDLLKQVVTSKKNPKLLESCLLGKMPFSIILNPERLNFGLKIHATDQKSEQRVHQFDNVEEFLLNLL